MKLQEIVFRRPVGVLQIFRNVISYGKEDNVAEARKEFTSWSQVNSKAGFIKANELFLPESILQNPDFVNCDLITLEDINIPLKVAPDFRDRHSRYRGLQNSCLQMTGRQRSHIFELRKTKGELELFFKSAYFELRTPARDDFKIGNLLLNKPLEIRINGKYDFSLTGRRDRTFIERDYLFEYLGSFASCKILREPADTVIKQVPTGRKMVDMRKPLW
jgi:hypothetical protein